MPPAGNMSQQFNPSPYGPPMMMTQNPGMPMGMPPSFGIPPFMRPPTGMPPMGMQTQGQQPMMIPPRPVFSGPNAPFPTVDDKLTTIFVTQISEGVSDDWMQRILSTCGPLRSWKRMTDAQGKPKAFGFCVYEQSRSVLLSLKVLGGEGNFPSVYGRIQGVGIELPSLVPGGQIKALKLNTDDAARKHSQKEAENRIDDPNEDIHVLENVNAIINEMKNNDSENFLSSIGGTGLQEWHPPHDGTLDEISDMAPDQRQFISKEIITFRERSAQKDRERKEKDERDEENRRRREEREKEWEREQARLKELKPKEYRGPSESTLNKRRRDDDDDPEEDRKRAERREKEMMQAFHERESRWATRESARLRRVEVDRRAELDEEDRKIKFDEIEKRFREYDDDEEEARGEEFYRDRNRWWARRNQMRLKEADADERDRKAENEEKERILRPPEPNAEDRAMIDSLIGGNQHEIQPEKQKEPTAAAPSLVVGRIMTSEEQERALRALVTTLPADREGLWKWSVRWEFLDEAALNTILKPFVAKKVAEYLGEEEKDLVDFCVDLVRERHSPQYIFEELQQPLRKVYHTLFLVASEFSFWLKTRFWLSACPPKPIAKVFNSSPRFRSSDLHTLLLSTMDRFLASQSFNLSPDHFSIGSRNSRDAKNWPTVASSPSDFPPSRADRMPDIRLFQPDSVIPVSLTPSQTFEDKSSPQNLNLSFQPALSSSQFSGQNSINFIANNLNEQEPIWPTHGSFPNKSRSKEDLMSEYNQRRQSDFVSVPVQQMMQYQQFQQNPARNAQFTSTQELSTHPNLVRSLSDRNLQHLQASVNMDHNLQRESVFPGGQSGTHHHQPVLKRNGSLRSHGAHHQQSSAPSKPVLSEEAILIASIYALFSTTRCIFMTDTDVDRHWRTLHDGKALPWWHFANGFNDFIEQWLIPRSKGALGIVIAVNKTRVVPERTRWLFCRGHVENSDEYDTDPYLLRIHSLVEKGSEIIIGELAGLLHLAEEFDLLPGKGGPIDENETRTRAVFNVANNEYEASCKIELKQHHRQCCRVLITEPSKYDELSENENYNEIRSNSVTETVIVKHAKPRNTSFSSNGVPILSDSITNSANSTTRSNSPAPVLNEFNELEYHFSNPSLDFLQLSQMSNFRSGIQGNSHLLPTLGSSYGNRRQSDSDISGNIQDFPAYFSSEQIINRQISETSSKFVPQHNRARSYPPVVPEIQQSRAPYFNVQETLDRNQSIDIQQPYTRNSIVTGLPKTTNVFAYDPHLDLQEGFQKYLATPVATPPPQLTDYTISKPNCEISMNRFGQYDEGNNQFVKQHNQTMQRNFLNLRGDGLSTEYLKQWGTDETDLGL
ncbi:hypothetical protein HK096_009945 [Nowakowskiella sp. JEL0078]|nr:hypothetical protein HK096_009945 [Nowakowskiella sp. JEL0078]